MSELFDDTNRQVLPRWYPFTTACQLGDLEPELGSETPKITSSKAFAAKVAEWRQKHTVPHGLDVVGTALVSGDFRDQDAREAAEFIDASREPSGSLGRQIAGAYLGGPGTPTAAALDLGCGGLANRGEIARLKVLVRMYPWNAIAWADLAYRYALVGENKKSLRCMELAVSLGRDNRFILRSAARCFLHLDESERSLFYLRRSRLSQRDPWLASAEIAISEGLGRKSLLIKPARTMIIDERLSLWALNELAATLGTLEARQGSPKKAKKLLLTALRRPNENTVAQAEWLALALRQEIVRPSEDILATYEADARRSLRAGQFEQALDHAKGWSRFQPFASRPAILASYIAAVCLQDDQEAVVIIEEAKATSPDSFLINNNHAFSLASLNRVGAASEILACIDERSLGGRDRSILTATQGLVAFRSGNISEGRKLYAKAIADLRGTKEYRGVAVASLFLAREECRIHSAFADSALGEAKTLAGRYEIKELIKYAETLAVNDRGPR